MKKFGAILTVALAAMVVLTSCNEEETDPAALTGRSVTYSLFTGASDWGYSGEVTFSERNDGLAVIRISLDGPAGDARFPAHLHFGQYSAEADMAAMLNPVDAASGLSETFVQQLATGSTITYADLVQFDGHIKIHLGDGDNKSVILAYGNIGSNPTTANSANVANCASW